MNYSKNFHLFFIPLVFLTTCHFSNFYPDPDDPGLSRFTSRGYNVATTYVNGKSFVNTGSFTPILQKDSTGSTVDTLHFKWNIYRNDSTYLKSAYQSISFLMPVPSVFNKTNLLAFNGQRFLNSVPVTLQDSSLRNFEGIATLYFVSVSETNYSSNQKYIKLSGLFDGNIGDSIHITKGRFDFEIYEDYLNF
ncbi:MAG: hypothetical protein ABI359_10260 [Ginsengibacter sp.]